MASPCQGKDWRALEQYINDEQARISTLNSFGITDTDPKTWPVAHTVSNTRHGYSFLVSQITQVVHQLLTSRVLK